MATKYTRGRRLEKAIGTPCPYCKRAMHFDRLITGAFPTLDHTHPRSKGGKHTVWACLDCNEIKRDMTMIEWQAFMAANPRWWDRDNDHV